MDITIVKLEMASPGPNQTERPIATVMIHDDDRTSKLSAVIDVDSLDVAFLMNRLVEVMQKLSETAAGDLPT